MAGKTDKQYPFVFLSEVGGIVLPLPIRKDEANLGTGLGLKGNTERGLNVLQQINQNVLPLRIYTLL